MKRCVLNLLLLFALFLLESCDYWGSFSFIIENKTDKAVSLSYREQYQSYEDVLPTYEHGEDYQLTISDKNVVITIEPDESRNFTYDVGMVDSSFPTEDDTPRAYGISPLWERIEYIVIGSDTILNSEYSEEKWIRKKNHYTLRLLPGMIR